MTIYRQNFAKVNTTDLKKRMMYSSDYGISEELFDRVLNRAIELDNEFLAGAKKHDESLAYDEENQYDYILEGLIKDDLSDECISQTIAELLDDYIEFSINMLEDEDKLQMIL